ncbi:glutathione S-transferase family protein [Methylobacterium brachythecii]|uniref:Glutathione S-transferase n=1 Tax=Methylobacterium brachythecii TaxID=1176177 RepID=A0A7W6F7N7_9HYPH|nr:glutathione S-transferase family protein [Methylobacterium brachythecii]MBB3903588.1 glutathione S-transferase [Methylobacterium brachythecii]GLS44060.1 glutathione S-transferase [Methylobacterium brachythecii]
MSDLVLYTNPMSRGRIARWMLEEVGQPYRTEILDFRGGHKSPAYLAINPMGKVPAIVHDGTVVTECAAICAYLADAFPQAGLAPASGSQARGDYYRWLFFAAGPLEAAVVNKVLKVHVPDDPQMRGMVGYGSLEAVLETIDGAVSRTEYLAGDRFSAADLYVGAHLGWGMQFGTIPKRPSFEAYAGRLYGRLAAVRAREIDDALIAERQASGAA